MKIKVIFLMTDQKKGIVNNVFEPKLKKETVMKSIPVTNPIEVLYASTKKYESLEDVAKLNDEAKEVRLQKTGGEQKSRLDEKELFKANYRNTVKSEKTWESWTYYKSIRKTKWNKRVNKVLRANKKKAIRPTLSGPLANFTVRQNESQFRFYHEHDGENSNDFLMNWAECKNWWQLIFLSKW